MPSRLHTKVMAKPVLDAPALALIKPLPPPPKPLRARYPGRQPLNDRAVLAGMLFVLQSGVPSEVRPPGNGLRLRHALLATLTRVATGGRWGALYEELLAKLRTVDRIDWSRVVVDSSSIRVIEAGQKQDRTPLIARDQVRSTLA